ncbi:chloroplast thylakoid lumen protein [Wolffia australiana]
MAAILSSCAATAARSPASTSQMSALRRAPAARAVLRRAATAQLTSCEGGAEKTEAAVSRRGYLASAASCAAALALIGISPARAAILEADDDVELLEKVRQDRKKRLERQGVISSSARETGYLQTLVYQLSKVGRAIDENDFSAAGAILGAGAGADWVKNANAAFSKLSLSSEEKEQVDAFNSSLASLVTSVANKDAESSKEAFVTSASALEKWVISTGLVGEISGL